MERIEHIRTSAAEAQDKANVAMKKHHEKKNKISLYAVGEDMLEHNADSRSKLKRSLTKTPSLKGRILRKEKYNRYNVQITEESSKVQTRTIPVSEITSEFPS